MTATKGKSAMTTVDYKRKALELVEDYLAGKASRETVWQWAQEVMMSEDFDELDAYLQDAIHGLWLLHDNEGSWVPDIDELKRIRDQLAG